MTDRQTDRGGFFSNLFSDAARQKRATNRYLHVKMSKCSSFIYIGFDLKLLFSTQMFCFSLDTEPEQQQHIVLFSTHKQHNSEQMSGYF